MWQNQLAHVLKIQVGGLPQRSTALLHPALAAALGRNHLTQDQHVAQSSEGLLKEFASQTEAYFGTSMFDSTERTLTFVLRLGCVLLHMRLLDNTPAIARIIYDTNCVQPKPDVTEFTMPTDAELETLATLLQDMNAATPPKKGSPSHSAFLDKIHALMVSTPRSQIDALESIAKKSATAILKIYDDEYSKITSKRSRTVPFELLQMLNNKSGFETSTFMKVTRLLLPSISNYSNSSAIEKHFHNMRNAPSTNTKPNDTGKGTAAINASTSYNQLGLKQLYQNYKKILPHAQCILRFYQMSKALTHNKIITMLNKLARITYVFQQKSIHHNKDIFQNFTLHVGEELMRKVDATTKEENIQRKLIQKLFTSSPTKNNAKKDT